MKLKAALVILIVVALVAGIGGRGAGTALAKTKAKNKTEKKKDDCMKICGEYSGDEFKECMKKCKGEAQDKSANSGQGKCPKGFAYIAPGEFMMGSPESEKQHINDEKRHKVKISKGFCMGKYEVTQGEWESVMGSNPSDFKNCGSSCPVENVSWDDVQAFIKKYNAKHSGGYRLPTEAEWEYAARAGTTTAFYTGDITETGCEHDAALNSAGWYCGNSGNTPHPVGKKEANAWGLYDMHGNVWEWVQDWYGDYPGIAVTDPTGPSSGSFRVFRGGGWDDSAWLCRAAFRHWFDPGYRLDLLGFRLARTLP